MGLQWEFGWRNVRYIIAETRINEPKQHLGVEAAAKSHSSSEENSLYSDRQSVAQQ
ncbi:hypothetical protein PROAA_670008 [Candidatus Propionivibrio aalborgensis]|uniref:Uncharacterized protein n=1 Tax=Candidatus Propionivibrio aalborgensis TaxID=1860101 RepID=A0A1A8Y186_9RHOO|nr:hypothetical protein PROAA_670008 [Candidatus Propionivibrio aalborgensis]